MTQYSQQMDELRENIEELYHRLLPAVLEDTPQNGEILREYVFKKFVDGQDLADGSVDNLYLSVVRLHQEGRLTWKVPPRTQVDLRKAEEAAPRPAQLSHADVLRQTADAHAAAGVIANCRHTANTAQAGSHAANQRVREGLKTFLNAFLASNKIERLTSKQADAFAVSFNAEERRLAENK